VTLVSERVAPLSCMAGRAAYPPAFGVVARSAVGYGEVPVCWITRAADNSPSSRLAGDADAPCGQRAFISIAPPLTWGAVGIAVSAGDRQAGHRRGHTFVDQEVEDFAVSVDRDACGGAGDGDRCLVLSSSS